MQASLNVGLHASKSLRHETHSLPKPYLPPGHRPATAEHGPRQRGVMKGGACSSDCLAVEDWLGIPRQKFHLLLCMADVFSANNS